MEKDYQDMITKVSQQVAQTFLRQEDNLVTRATSLDADIAKLTRHIGLETTKIVVEHVRDDLVKKNNRKASSFKRAHSFASTAFSDQSS